MLKRHKDSKNKKISKLRKNVKNTNKNPRIQTKLKNPNIKRFTFIGKASTPTCYLIPINSINPNLHLTPKDDIFLKIQKILFKFKKF